MCQNKWMVTDRLSDLLITPDRISSENLLQERVLEQSIRFVGNIMIDTLEDYRHKATSLSIKNIVDINALRDHHFLTELQNEHFNILTLHRSSNVNNQEVTNEMLFICLIHPRVIKKS